MGEAKNYFICLIKQIETVKKTIVGDGNDLKRNSSSKNRVNATEGKDAGTVNDVKVYHLYSFHLDGICLPGSMAEYTTFGQNLLCSFSWKISCAQILRTKKNQ